MNIEELWKRPTEATTEEVYAFVDEVLRKTRPGQQWALVLLANETERNAGGAVAGRMFELVAATMDKFLAMLMLRGAAEVCAGNPHWLRNEPGIMLSVKLAPENRANL